MSCLLLAATYRYGIPELGNIVRMSVILLTPWRQQWVRAMWDWVHSRLGIECNIPVNRTCNSTPIPFGEVLLLFGHSCRREESTKTCAGLDGINEETLRWTHWISIYYPKGIQQSMRLLGLGFFVHYHLGWWRRWMKRHQCLLCIPIEKKAHCLWRPSMGNRAQIQTTAMWLHRYCLGHPPILTQRVAGWQHTFGIVSMLLHRVQSSQEETWPSFVLVHVILL